MQVGRGSQHDLFGKYVLWWLSGDLADALDAERTGHVVVSSP
jgi:hypothetical protein